MSTLHSPRKGRYILLVVLALLLAGGAVIALRVTIMGQRLTGGYESIEPVDLSALPDGTYHGEFRDFLVRVEVAVEIVQGTIREVRILRQDSGPGYDAPEMPDRIVAAQNPRVDVVAGATGSSKAVMTAVYREISRR